MWILRGAYECSFQRGKANVYAVCMMRSNFVIENSKQGQGRISESVRWCGGGWCMSRTYGCV